jgi:hypothetical protein
VRSRNASAAYVYPGHSEYLDRSRIEAQHSDSFPQCASVKGACPGGEAPRPDGKADTGIGDCLDLRTKPSRSDGRVTICAESARTPVAVASVTRKRYHRHRQTNGSADGVTDLTIRPQASSFQPDGLQRR